MSSATRACKAANVADYLLEGKNPGQLALVDLGSENTYGELEAAAYDIARYLISQGARKGDRAILISENNFFWVAAYLGALRAGMICVPLSPSINLVELDYIIQLTEARFGFVQARSMSRIHKLSSLSLVTDAEVPVLPACTSMRDLGSVRREAAGCDCAFPDIEPNDLAALMFTSGTTGQPRGVMVTHGNIMANTESIIQYLELADKDRIMTVLPFHYCFGTSLLHTHLRVGGTLVLDRRFLFPEKVLQRMRETECTGFAGVPSHYQILLRRSTLKTMNFPHLRYVQQAGGHLAPTFLRELQEALPATKIFVMYGQTEATARLSYLPPTLLDRKSGSIGKGIPGVRLQVLDEGGEPVKPGGQVGEIVAEGPNITRGYWQADSETAVSFRNGRLYTGDLGTIDEDGFIYIVDRAKDFIKCGGKRTSCRQIEETLLEFNGLLEAAVVGMPDEVLGEAVKAFVVPRDKNASEIETQLRAFCRERIPWPLVPKEIVVLESIPKNNSGKVMKSSLKGL